MYVPPSFSDKIASTFYDKTFSVAKRTHTKDAEGGTTTTVGAPTQHQGNVQHSLNTRSREAYGITEHIDIAITTTKDVAIDIDDQLTYDGVAYTVTDVRPTDSHLLVIGKKR